jgi:hypothetical protein
MASGALAKPIEVRAGSITMAWARSSGPVTAYLVWVSRNGGSFRAETVTFEPRVELEGAAGERVRVTVAALGRARGRPLQGPTSPASAEVRFVAKAPGGGGSGSGGSGSGGSDGDGGGRPGSGSGGAGGGDAGLELPVYVPKRLLKTEIVWEVLDTGDFFGDGDDDLLLRVGGRGVFALELVEGKSWGLRLVTWPAAGAARGPHDGDRDTILVHGPDGALQGWAMDARVPERRWALPPSLGPQYAAGDFDGNGVEEVFPLHLLGLYEPGGGAHLPTLPDSLRLGVVDAEGDGRDDLVVADLSDGRVDVWDGGRTLRSAPSLEVRLEDVTVARLQGPEGDPWLVGVDRGGRIRARRVEDARTRTIGLARRGDAIHALDVDGDGRDELLLAREGELILLRGQP